MTDMKQIASSFASIREVPGYLSQQGTQESEEVQKMQQEQGNALLCVEILSEGAFFFKKCFEAVAGGEAVAAESKLH